VLWETALPDRAPGVAVRTEVVPGLAARVLLQCSVGADMLVLGTGGDQAATSSSARSAGPVIRACLLRAPCPVVVISSSQDPLAGTGTAGMTLDVAVPV
jgi:hypothetical protein